MPETKFGMRLGSTTLHIITGVSGWYSGMTLTSECGVKHVNVLEENANKNSLPATTCKRCIKILGWNL
jgi:hypothetical protein